MKLIAMVLVLALVIYAEFANTWLDKARYTAYVGWLSDKFKLNNPWLFAAVAIMPPLLIFAVIYLALAPLLHGVVGFFLMLLTLWFCIGPLHAALPEADSSGDSLQDFKQLVVSQHQNVLGVLFWFLIFGPMGAVFYRLTAAVNQGYVGYLATVQQYAEDLDAQEIPISVTALSLIGQSLQQLFDIVDWVPVRLSLLFFCLAGDLAQGIGYLILHIADAPAGNREILAEGTLYAMHRDDLEQKPVNGDDVENLYRLIWRAGVIFLVLVAALTLGELLI